MVDKRKYGALDILKIPLRCAPVVGTLVGLQILLSGIVPTIQIIVTANFINTAISVAEKKAEMSIIYAPLLLWQH
jgi:ATP-binding cassette subfamily B protein